MEKLENNQLASKFHLEIAELIRNKSLGDIFNIKIPKDNIFLESDFSLVSSMLGYNKIPKNIYELSTNEDFMASIDPQNSILTIYKDTSNNLSLFKYKNEQIEKILKKYPEAYSQIINNLVAELPGKERRKYGLLPINTRQMFVIEGNFDKLPPTVIKALILLIQDPRPRK